LSKRSPKSIDVVNDWLRRGDGVGEGAEFRPFYRVRDVPSLGRSAIDTSIKTTLAQHLLSDIEYGYYLLGEFSRKVRYIRCQAALTPIEETIEIARSLDIPHPFYPGTRVPHVRTSDLVFDMLPPSQHVSTVISCKPAADLDLSHPDVHRTLELLLIEKTYWQRRPVHWFIGTDKALPKNKVYNLDFFRSTVKSRELDALDSRMTEFTERLLDAWRPTRTLNQLLWHLSRRLALRPIDVFTLLGRAIWFHRIYVDLNIRKFCHEEPLPVLRLATSGEAEELTLVPGK